MAAGDRKIKITSTDIFRGNPVRYEARWVFYIENRLGQDVPVNSGTTAGSFGTPAAWRAMTGLQMETQINTDIAADVNLPARDSIT